MVLRNLAAAAVLLLLPTCSHFGLGLPCTVGPIDLDKGASTRLTRSEKEQIVTLNETGEELCAWKPDA